MSLKRQQRQQLGGYVISCECKGGSLPGTAEQCSKCKGDGRHFIVVKRRSTFLRRVKIALRVLKCAI